MPIESTPQQERQSPTDRALWIYLDRMEAGGKVDMEALCQEHLELTDQLKSVHFRLSDRNTDLQSMGERRSSFAASLRRSVGIDLDPEEETPVPDSTAFRKLSELSRRAPGDRRYRFHGEIARGGMGAIIKVWDEDLRRHLAMKVILPDETGGSDGSALTGGFRREKRLIRFLEEAQVTGQLDHPAIVPVHELGIDQEGRIYFTMRLVKGRDLRKIYRLVKKGEEGWNRTRALGVLLQVCEAMAFAHAKGVIHRDLKPANIMVGRYGQVHVMDWGLAKVIGREDRRDPDEEEIEPVRTDRRDDEETCLVTMDGDVIGTPAYMSPEQARGEQDRIGPRSDIYSLGAILYHLLTGRVPYTKPGVGVDGCTVWKWLLERPPEPVQELAPDVPPELEAICEKAMARAPEDRYGDMEEMADDLRSYLENRVVRAYRTGFRAGLLKWVRRNRLAAATIALSLVLLLGGAVTASLVLAAKNRDIAMERDRAATAAQEARAINDFLVNRMLMAATPAESMGHEVTVAEVLDNASKTAGESLSDKPVVEAGVRQTLGDVYWRLGRHRDAEKHLARAFDLRKSLLGPNHGDTLCTENHLGLTLVYNGKSEEGEDLLRDGLERSRLFLGEEHPDTLHAIDALGDMLSLQGRFSEAAALFRENLETRRRLTGDEDKNTLGTMHRLSYAVKHLGRLEEAESLLLDVLEKRRRILSSDHPDTLAVVNDLACLYHDMSRLEDAEKYYREALEGTRRIYGEDHLMYAVALNNIATLLLDRGGALKDEEMLGEAEALIRRSLAIRRKVYSDDHPLVATGLHNLSSLLLTWGRYDEALETMEQAIAIRRAKLGPDHDETLRSGYALAVILDTAGRDAEAETAYRSVIEAVDRIHPPDHWERGLYRVGLGNFLVRRMRPAEAEPFLLEAHPILAQALGEDNARTQKAAKGLVEGYQALGLTDEEAKWREKLAGEGL